MGKLEKLGDYLRAGVGLEAVIEVNSKMAEMLPDQKYLENPAYFTGALICVGGGALIAYSAERIINRYKEKK